MRTFLSRVTVATIPAALMIGACGSTDSSGGTSGGAVPLSEVPARIASAACEAASNCLGPLFTTLLHATSCEASLTVSIQQGDFSLAADAVTAGTVVYDSSKLPACVSAIRTSGCGFLGTRLGVLCADAFHGTKKAGTSCDFNGECATGLFCEMTQCPGVCTSLLSAGRPCTADDQCMSGLQCGADPSSSTGARICQPQGSISVTGAEGSACDPTTSQFCQTGLVCALTSLNPGRFACEKPSTGTTCHVAFPEGCPSGQYCSITQTSAVGTCMTLPKVGSACAARYPNDKDPVCPLDSVCSGGTCKAYASLGSPCAADVECYSKVCKAGTCAATRCAQ